MCLLYVCMCVYSPCRVGHGDAECVIEGGKFIRFEEFCVDVNALIKTVDSLHSDLLHGVLTGNCIHTGAHKCNRKQTHRNNNVYKTLKL